MGGSRGVSGGFTRLKRLLPGLKTPKFGRPGSSLEDSWLGHDSARGRRRASCSTENEWLSSELIQEEQSSWLEDVKSPPVSESSVSSRNDDSGDDSSSNISGSYDVTSPLKSL